MPSTFWQFQMLEGKTLLKETEEKMKNECHDRDSEFIEEKVFFDAHFILPVYHGGDFFTASTNLILKFTRDMIFCA
jgi:hypothetical protein